MFKTTSARSHKGGALFEVLSRFSSIRSLLKSSNPMKSPWFCGSMPFFFVTPWFSVGQSPIFGQDPLFWVHLLTAAPSPGFLRPNPDGSSISSKSSSSIGFSLNSIWGTPNWRETTCFMRRFFLPGRATPRHDDQRFRHQSHWAMR